MDCFHAKIAFWDVRCVCIYIFIYAFLCTAIEVQFAKISACAVGGSWLLFNVYFSKLFALQ